MTASDMLPLSQRPYLFDLKPSVNIQKELGKDVEKLYGRVTDLRDISVTDVWLLSRDLVLAVDRWSSPLTAMPGSTKMDIAVDVAWDFAERRGGVKSLRDRIAGSIPLLPRFMGKWLLGRVLNKGVARQLVRFVLELAVREMKKLSGSQPAEGT